jgi:hypothetical protein
MRSAYPGVAWLLLVASLSGQQSALRIRVWRALRAAGAVPLRDGVYIAPDSPAAARGFDEQRAAVAEGGGAAYVLPLPRVCADDEAAFVALFDRADEYAAFSRALDAFVASLAQRTEADARRALRQLKRDLAAIEAIDFFPRGAKGDAARRLRDAENALVRAFSPEEPAAVRAPIAHRDANAYRGRTWATRERLWIDRVASAWLIRRFIDRDARFLWLRRPADCPRTAVGFDFDGADFTHVEDRVTFEVLVETFGLAHDEALLRIGTIVHALDVGGERVAEAVGLEAVLAGARERCAADDDLLQRFSAVLDDMYLAFSKQQRDATVTE